MKNNKWNNNDNIGNIAPPKKPEHIQLVESLGDDLEALRVEISQLTKAINEFSKVFDKPKAEAQDFSTAKVYEAQILDSPSVKRGRGRPKGSVKKQTGSNLPVSILIRKQRLAKNLSLKEVGEACGVSLQYVSNIEAGRTIVPWNRLEFFAQVLDISKEDLNKANLESSYSGQKAAPAKPLVILRKAAV